jgi:hypothetical protein
MLENGSYMANRKCFGFVNYYRSHCESANKVKQKELIQEPI